MKFPHVRLVALHFSVRYEEEGRRGRIGCGYSGISSMMHVWTIALYSLVLVPFLFVQTSGYPLSPDRECHTKFPDKSSKDYCLCITGTKASFFCYYHCSCARNRCEASSCGTSASHKRRRSNIYIEFTPEATLTVIVLGILAVFSAFIGVTTCWCVLTRRMTTVTTLPINQTLPVQSEAVLSQTLQGYTRLPQHPTRNSPTVITINDEEPSWRR